MIPMFVKVFTALSLSLLFATEHPPYNTTLEFRAAINGTFYDTETDLLASLLFVDGKRLGEFPVCSSKVRGGFVCLRSGEVLAGYFKVYKDRLYFSDNPLLNDIGLLCDEKFWKEVKWAVTGGGLFLKDGKVVKNVGKKERLDSYIVNHPKFSFLLLHNDRRTISGCISFKRPPYEVAKAIEGKYSAMLRLDGGSSVIIFKGKKPRWVNNAIGVK